ncbi:hypothetical protein GCM10009411_08030 [Shewanella litoralis]|uniref:Uncharacterized protein n=1 Tax=Shewanella litoralis TaxID=2282700 RepID=A0ABQ2R225_9GAMM|nr:hypothetical protein GCM10009411_08030 [Shewanella litoralis]
MQQRQVNDYINKEAARNSVVFFVNRPSANDLDWCGIGCEFDPVIENVWRGFRTN